MALNGRAKKIYKDLDLPLSYRINDERDRLIDCSNIFSNQGRLETRHGISRYNAVVIGSGLLPVLSQSHFKDIEGNLYVFAKVGTVLYKVSETGAHTELKTGLSATTKHRGITLNNRHIISLESDGLFQYDTTVGFTQLGQAVPATPTVALVNGEGSLSDGTWYIKTTFYSTVTGFESNASLSSDGVTTSTPNSRITVTLPGTAANGTIDKIRVYASDDGATWVYVTELAIATASYNFDDDPTSTSTPPTLNAAPLAGGGKFLTEFNGSLVYSGNDTYKNDVFFSEQNLPDAFDDAGTGTILYATGNGPVTGLATGLFNDSHLDPYVIVFKERSVSVYSELGGSARFAVLSNTVGCISDSTIEIRNGDVMFMSERGWHYIVDGKLLKDSKGNVLTLGMGDIDDIFTSASDYENSVNQSDSANFHSVYYPQLDQYITWVSEGSTTTKTRAYNFEFATSKGFKKYNFPMSMASSCIAENSDGQVIVLMGDNMGRIYKHSILESKTDIDETNKLTTLNAYGILTWFDGNDMATTYNFGDVMIKGIGENDDITLKGFINYDLTNYNEASRSFSPPGGGFILDESVLDEDSFGDGRAASIVHAYINKSGQNFALGIYQDTIDGRMTISKIQVDFNKNGNRN